MKLKELKPRLILQMHSDYPSLLKEIPNPPSGIYILGEWPDFQKPWIAVVGTRKATSQGQTIAKEMAKKLSEAGVVIVSGLAMGIDTASHEGALAANGKTVAVLACGLDDIYPRQNENLAEKIVDFGGAIISEYPIGTPALPKNFLERNRIVSGLSIATIIIEAPQESGALVTARLAAEQGREVLVVPGPVNHPNYCGSHKLIRDGARLISSINDIIEDLALEIKTDIDLLMSRVQRREIKDENQLFILKTIQESGQSLSIDKIFELTKLEPQVVNQAIALLVIEGIIKETERGYTI